MKKIVLLVFVVSVIATSLASNLIDYSTFLKENIDKIHFYSTELAFSASSVDHLLPVNLDSTNSSSCTFQVDIDQPGFYYLELSYENLDESLLDLEISVKVNNQFQFVESQNLSLPKLWEDVSSTYPVDRSGNELVPEQKISKRIIVYYLRHPSNVYNYPLFFKFEAGKSFINIKLKRGKIRLFSLRVVAPIKLMNAPTVNKQKEINYLKVIEAEKYSYKNDTTVNPRHSKDIDVVPYDTYKTRLNTLGGDRWKNPGQTVYYEFEVPEDGYYKIALKYKQDYNVGMNSYRRFYINGKLLYDELANYPFKYTSDWKIETLLSNGKPIDFWLKKGKNVLAIETTCGIYEETILEISDMIQEINDLALQIRKIVGFNPDRYIEWDIESYFPGIVEKLKSYTERLEINRDFILSLNGPNCEVEPNFDYAIDLLKSFIEDPNSIPRRIEQLNGNIASIVTELTAIVNKLKSQPLLLDQIIIYSGDKQPIFKKASIFRRFLEWTKRFIYSFKIEDKQKFENNRTITVWVNRPRTYLDVIQRLIDEDFYKRTGIDVKLSLINNEQKLILAYSAGKAPDVAIGISNWLPFELGIRGALLDLRQFEDFNKVIKNFTPGAFIPYIYENKCFALPETQDFYVLFYRKDIIEKLGLTIPQTWDDVKLLMPELQRYGMSFYIPLSGVSGFKPWLATAPFIFQANGKLYSDDGLSTAIDDENTICALKLMTDLFKIYGLALQVPNFFEHFRSGTIPMGVSNLSTYIQLTIAAPELKGFWGIALAPGILDEKTGQILRWAPGSAQSVVIFNTTKDKEAAWEFIKWWTSEKIQTRFAKLLELTYGKEFLWNTANLKAFQNLSIPLEHKKVILEQWKWLKEVPKTPASYMLEREISNIWSRVVFNNVNLRVAVEESVNIVNREIERKLTEFGYIENGKVIKKYKIPDLEDILRWWNE
ncbi:MAG: extracellular solute-binding protein [Thermosipho sp. (in: Bacteria)]|nr:extracellular solute-binding protein [Thermosipho sp. (in: thermotogales)]